jgi:hypothetical protein
MRYIYLLSIILSTICKAGIFADEVERSTSRRIAEKLEYEIPVGCIHINQKDDFEEQSPIYDHATGMLLSLPCAKSTKTIISCGHILESFNIENQLQISFEMGGNKLKVVDYVQLAPDPLTHQDIALFYLNDPIDISTPISLCSTSPQDQPAKLFSLCKGFSALSSGIHTLENVNGTMSYYHENTYQFVEKHYETSFEINGIAGLNYPNQRFPRLEYLANLKPSASQLFIGDSGSPWLRKKEADIGYELIGLTHGASSPLEHLSFDEFISVVKVVQEKEKLTYHSSNESFELFYSSFTEPTHSSTFVNDLTPINLNYEWIYRHLR